MPSNQDISEQIADLIHRTFKHGRGIKDISSLMGASQASEDIRRELMTCAVQLKRHDLNEEVLGRVEANIRTANVSGIMTDETHDTIQELLKEIHI